MRVQETQKISKMPIEIKNLKKFFKDNLENVDKEKYGLSWAGKINAKKEALIPTSKTLSPQEEESKNWDETENIFIEGDNLEALKLLQRKYFEKIKMIYIDPPYNTGKDFIYRDNFARTTKEELEESGEMEDGKLLTTNAKTNGRFHSDWLNMMYSRLFLAHKLLKDDGVIFVSIDDNEVANLRLLMDEIFGEENFVANIIWYSKYTTSNDAKYLSTQHENILLYGKNKDHFNVGLLDRSEKQDKNYKNRDNDSNGAWKPTPIHAKSGTESSNYTIIFPNGIEWKAPKGRYPRYSKARLLELFNKNELYFNSKGNVDKKTYLSEVKQGITAGTVWSYQEVGHTHSNNEELASLMGKGKFPNPKGTKLIKQLCKIANVQIRDLILDFFAGSGTTGDAVMQLNAEDGGNRKYILVQLDEEIDKKKDKTAYDFVKYDLKKERPTIAEISRERIRRAGKQIKNEELKIKNEKADNKKDKVKRRDNKLDIGFRSFKISNSNYRQWQAGDFDMFEEKLLEEAKLFVENPLIDNYKNIDIVFETIVKEGFALSSKISNKNQGEFWEIQDEDRKMIIDFGDKIDPAKVKELNLNQNDIFVCFDSALTDSDKINLIRSINLRVI